MAIGVLTFFKIWKTLFISIVTLNQPNTVMTQQRMAPLTSRLASASGPRIMAARFFGWLEHVAIHLVTSSGADARHALRRGSLNLTDR
jgi:ABC-type glycerol-3-phosphate transport system permease component